MEVYEFTRSPPEEKTFAYFIPHFRTAEKLGNFDLFSSRFSLIPLIKEKLIKNIFANNEVPMRGFGLEKFLQPNNVISKITDWSQKPLFVGIFYRRSHTFNEEFFSVVNFYWLSEKKKYHTAFMLTAASGFFMTQIHPTFEYSVSFSCVNIYIHVTVSV